MEIIDMATIHDRQDRPYEVKDGREPAPGLPLASASTCPTSAGTRPCIPSAPAGSAPSSIQGRERHKGKDRHGLHDARRPTGMRISIDDPEARAFRAGVIEWLMIEPSPRLPGLRRRRRMPPPGHDGHDRPHLPALPVQEAHLPEPGPWALSSTTR